MPEEAQRQYELVVILPPNLEGADLQNLKKEIEELVSQAKGSIDFKEGKKRNLAYPINKQGQAIYLVSQLIISPEKIAGLSRELKLNKQVLRHLITQSPSLVKVPEGKPAAKRERSKKAIKKREEKPSKFAGKEKKEEKVKLEEIDKKLDKIIEEI